MIAAGIGTSIVYCAAPGPAVKKKTVSIGHPAQSERFCLGMKMLNNPLLKQSLGNVLQILLQFKFVHQVHSNEIYWLYFNRKTAAGGPAVVTKSLFVFGPCGSIIYVCLSHR